MKYTDLEDTTEFHRNMRKTPFLKLFPHWYDEKDALINAIGDEVERIKASAIFSLLNVGIRPPVLIWQESLTHDNYSENHHLEQLPSSIKIDAPLYKTWGEITLTNNTKEDIDGIEITFNDTHGFAINQLIAQNDIIKINLKENKVQLNDETIKPQQIGKGMPYFLTCRNNEVYEEDTPLHNEVIKLNFNTDTALTDTIVTDTIEISENIDNWTVYGTAYTENFDKPDSWVVIKDKSAIEYELDLTNISKINFSYKGDEGTELQCYVQDNIIFNKDVNTKWTNYDIDTTNFYGKGKIKFIQTDDTEGSICINDINYTKNESYNIKCDIDVDINMENAVFINEQNIKVTGLELIPIERIELYAKYDFDYNTSYNGWQKVYQKKYDNNTNVIYDMITTHFYTKEFYVDVWFKTLQYPYRVGFPCYQDAELDSMFHINNRLDTIGGELGLERRMYKKDIDEEEYPNTFPAYYPYDIEQDYWYYKRLISEYTWNDIAINDIDIEDTDGNALFRLYSINPFCEDFVVHAQSRYPTDKEFVDYNEYYPVLIMQKSTENYVAQSEYSHIINLLGHNDYTSTINLNNNSDNNDVIYKKDTKRFYEVETDSKSQYFNSSGHISKELLTYFDLTNLPENINIDDISITIEAESTDNKTNKFSTEDTGLIIENFNGKEIFLPLTADKSYQLPKQSITYSLNKSKSLQKLISEADPTGEEVDENILQKATIGAFSGRIKDYIDIPFKLIENGTEVKDFTNIYVDFNEVKRSATIAQEENGDQYIRVYVPNQAIINEMTISCDSETHKKFVTKIDIAKLNIYTEDDEGNQIVDYQYIQGPLVDNNPATIEIEEEWHTSDIRNILQKQGIYFKNIFKNNDTQSSTTIILYNIRLDIHYSQKNSDFQLSTYVNVQDAQKPNIGTYEISIKNIGDKPLKTHIDIITPPNIQLEKNYIDVDLNIGASLEESINIIPEYPIIDGIYEILTFCDSEIKRDSITVFSEGLIQTNVNIEPHHGKYNDYIKLQAEVKAIDSAKLNGTEHQVQFYINGYKVGQPVELIDNKATSTLFPGDYKFTKTGLLKLEAHYLGNTKYASSRGYNTIFISKNSTEISLNAPDKGIYKGTYEAKATVTYFDGESYKPVNDGFVTFYVGDEILTTNITPDYSNGIFTASVLSLEHPPNDYILTARYDGSNVYSGTETSQNFEIIGGNVTIFAFDKEVRPNEIIRLQAKVVDKNNKALPGGYLDFYNEELDIDYKNIPIFDGIGSTPEFPVNVTLNNDNSIKDYDIQIYYHGAVDEPHIYEDGTITGHLRVRKSEVEIEHSSLYKGSQREPLGFLVKVKDINTNNYVNEGTITIQLPQNNIISADVDNNGVARLVYDAIDFTGLEWNDLLKWTFSTAGDNSLYQIDEINEEDNYTSDDLWAIYHDIETKKILDFCLDENNNTDFIMESSQHDYNINIEEFLFIKNGILYARTDNDMLRILFKNDFYDLPITYTSPYGYKTKTINIKKGLRIYGQNVDIDIHSYDLTYTSNDNIICYVTNKNTDTPIQQTNNNLISDTEDFDNTDTGELTGEKYNDLYAIRHIDNSQSSNYIDILYNNTPPIGAFQPGDQYVLSFYAKGNGYLNTFFKGNTNYIGVKTLEVTENCKKVNSISNYSEGRVNCYLSDEWQYYSITYELDPYNNNTNVAKKVQIRIQKQVDAYICGVTLEKINNLNINFIFDNELLYQAPIFNGLAIFDNNKLSELSSGQHLLEVDYYDPSLAHTTRSYSLINIQQAIPIMEMEIDRVARNKNSYITVKISTESLLNIPLNGIVSLYLNDEKIGEQFLYGNESIDGIANPDNGENTISSSTHNTSYLSFNYVMPNDVDIENKYTLKAVYEGNEYFKSAEISQNIHEEPFSVEISSEDVDINKPINIASNEPCSIDFQITFLDDVINEGMLSLVGGADEIIDSCYVINNHATLLLPPLEIQEYQYALQYTEATHYKQDDIQIITFNSIEAQDKIIMPNASYKTIQQALMCLKNNGTISLSNNLELNKDLIINKDCYIIGGNDIKLINNANKDINIINLKTTHIKNVHFTSDNYKTQIINNGNLIINYSILDKNIILHNNQTLTAQRNFIYGICSGQDADLNDNWWGTNTPPYDVQSHIIIQAYPLKSPAVISEVIDIVGEMTSSNGESLLLPEANFTFSADSGYFSIDYGKMTNHQIKTTYFDADKEGNIYFTVDNETVICPIYEYERKTEVIIDEMHEVPLGYQIPITAKVQSAADVFYEFDNNNVSKSTEIINQGYVSFFIDEQQVGYVPVINGEATVTVFFTDKFYANNTNYTIKAIYHPEEYYFASEGTITITAIEETENICYISTQSGNDNNSGKYGAPFKTIEQAITSNKAIIYLLDEAYPISEHINISYSCTIKSFKNYTKINTNEIDIENNDCIFYISRNANFNLFNIILSDNEIRCFDSYGNLKVSQCILYNNNKIISFHTNSTALFQYCAVVDNDILINNNTTMDIYKYCWFGENNPNIAGVNNHIQMSIESSKDVLYVGTVAHITAQLNTYKNGRFIYLLDKPLPLRIAKFATTYGSMKPLMDYTYNRKSTSVLNTLEDVNSTQYIISIDDNTNYIDHPVILQCSIKNIYGESANGTCKIFVSGENYNTSDTVNIEDGIATMEIERLNAGKYSLTCNYIDTDNNARYTSTKSFIVKKPDIITKEFSILSESNLYYANVKIELEDNFGNKINNEKINIKIDKKLITTIIIKDGIYIGKIPYNKIPNGQYKITIDNYDNNSNYDNFIAYQDLNVNKKDTQIIFNYDKFEARIMNNIEIRVIDDEGTSVNGGYIDIEFDNQLLYSDIPVINGSAYINNFIIEDNGQYNIVIYYSGVNDYYNDSIYVNGNIGVGIFEVNFGIKENQYIHTDIGKPFILSTTVTDVSNQPVRHGYVNCYIDDILLNKTPYYISNGTLSIQHDLPSNINAGTYPLRLEYIDSLNMYTDTFMFTSLEVGKIKTTINMNAIHSSPGKKVTENYNISTIYGNATSGTLIAKYNDNIIGSSIVTDNINNQITITTPFEPATNDYDICLEYFDKYIYDNDSFKNKIIMKKEKVNIEPSHTWYYPNQRFNFVATITDNDGNRINIGEATLYKDGVRYTEPQEIINGQFITRLEFNQAKEHSITIIYDENDYYDRTQYSFKFKVDRIDLKDIQLKNIDTDKYYIENHILHSLPNQLIECELDFITEYDYNIKDGVVDIIIDNNNIKSYYIAESNKNINFNIGNLNKGEHTLTIKYHDSTLFNNYETTIPLYIIAKRVDIIINEDEAINAKTKSINIITEIHDKINPTANIDGTLRYYIGVPVYEVDNIGNSTIIDYDYRFIGISKFNNNYNEYSYILSDNLLTYAINQLETSFNIKVEYVENDEYEKCENIQELHITQQECAIELISVTNDSIYKNYRDIMDINFKIYNTSDNSLIAGDSLIDFYIDDELIGNAIANDGNGNFKYKLNDKYPVQLGDQYYQLRAQFNGSVVNCPTQTLAKLYINHSEPIMKIDDEIEAYYGGEIKVDNVLINTDGFTINDGRLIYTIDNQEYTFNVNTPGVIEVPYTTKESLALHIRYDTNNANYLVFEKTITVNLQKNDIILNVTTDNEVYRGTTFYATINAVSHTTSLPVNITIQSNTNQYTMENGMATIPLKIPINNKYSPTVEFEISSLKNQFFHSSEKSINVIAINKDYVTVNKDKNIDNSNATTLAKALDIVADYGVIEIISPRDNQDITYIRKNVTIKGDIQVNDWRIINEGQEVTIEGLNFECTEANTISSLGVFIVNSGTLSVVNCQFNNAQESAIRNDNNITVYNCSFKNNKAKNGAGIYISNTNYQTTISECTFTENYVSLEGSCIYSNKGNNVEIINNEFYNNNSETSTASCICVGGNIYLSSNIFYNNNHAAEIHFVRGTLSMEKNLFDGNIRSIKSVLDGSIDADFNYWGYNDIESIENNNTDLMHLENWLISSRKDYGDTTNNEEDDAQHITVGLIEQYINRLEKEITTITPINKRFPVYIGNSTEINYYLNDEIESASSNMQIRIGQQILE